MIDRLKRLPEFECIIKDDKGNVKPVMIFIVDCGPDENPRYDKVIYTGIHHFVDYNLDALFIATNAPGRNAFNFQFLTQWRRMAPLSKELAG